MQGDSIYRQPVKATQDALPDRGRFGTPISAKATFGYPGPHMASESVSFYSKRRRPSARDGAVQLTTLAAVSLRIES